MASKVVIQQLDQANINEKLFLKAFEPLLMIAALLFSCLLMTACASTPRSFALVYPKNTQSLFFPDATQPSRYEFLGDLVGEHNFPHIKNTENGFWQKVLTTLTGEERKKNERLLLRPINGLTLKNNNILVADAGRHAIYIFDVNNNLLGIWENISKEQSFSNPVGLSLGPNDTIIVSDSVLGEVFVFNQQQELLFRFGKSLLERPTGLAYHGASQQIFVVDSKQHKIFIFNQSGEKISSIGDNLSDDSVAFNRPTFIAVTDEYIYVTDTMNARVIQLTPDGKLVNVIGQRGFQLGDMNRPKGVAVDSQQHLYVIESYFDYLLVFNKDGKLLLPLGGTGNKPGEFYLPSGVWVDNQDRIFVADMANGRVSVFQYLGSDSE